MLEMEDIQEFLGEWKMVTNVNVSGHKVRPVFS